MFRAFIEIALLYFTSWLLIPASPGDGDSGWFLPIRAQNRQSWESVQLTHIGAFGLLRKARPQVPAHYHTGVDFKRPNANYFDEPIFPAAYGIVASQRTDGPFAQIIIEHFTAAGDTVWTVYEHLAGVKVITGDTVLPQRPLGRFMNTEELQQHGWQFDHLHFEILKRRPQPVLPAPQTPMRRLKPYNLECYTRDDLDNHYYDPREFLEVCWMKAEEEKMSSR
jgi:murein DD-endopeptidase MepM/ murein hydrolase activator NlpD